ncbi:sigma-54 dependent transcriptional regulator [Massilia sp. W12]|uniref:sigma-54-dependent transcriptional regulator n=1 Tax=Massilia sp. W12 TaxID=3126507 RepID=UPI0030D1F941
MTAPRVLVVDDEQDLRDLLEITILRMGLDVDSAEDLQSARKLLAKHEYALVLTDMRLPDGMGIELVSEISSKFKNTPVAVVTAYGSAENAVVALKAGAFDYVTKPVALDQLRLLVQSALGLGQNKSAPEAAPGSRLIGASRAMQDLRAQIARLARSMAPISITGESGSGKELAAREIHAQSARANKPFIAVNCGAIPETLMEAEFFGYRKGAFTGASDERDGFFQAANGGTLMLDEVADLPLPMQVKLLRAIQERRVRKIGATAEEPVDVRIISATHQNLAEWVEKGKFRQDLFYRLNVIELSLPPLRERLDDLGVLTENILQRLGAAHGVQGRLSEAALHALSDYSFPGNVRELENILERALAFANDGVIEVSDLALKPGRSLSDMPQRPADIAGDGSLLHSAPPAAAPAAPAPAETPPPAAPPQAETQAAGGVQDVDGIAQAVAEFWRRKGQDLPSFLDQVEKQIIISALEQTTYNRTAAAELLGISFRQLRYQVQRLEIHDPD